MTRPYPDFGAVAALLGDRSRALMVEALAEGRPLSAGELARRARVTAQTASSHLRRLVDGGLLRVTTAGRRREFRIAGLEVAQLVEALSIVARAPPAHEAPAASLVGALRSARTCYDHLAGALGVALTEGMRSRGWLQSPACSFAVTDSGRAWFGRLDIDMTALASGHRTLTRACQDWSERRPHLAGALGAALATRLFELNWIERLPTSRAIRLTRTGRCALATELGPFG